MDGSTEPSYRDVSASNLFKLALDAAARGELGAADELCRKAAARTQDTGNVNAAAIYHRIGTIAYRRGNIDAAEEWYLKSLAIDEMKGDEVGKAQSYHVLSAVANTRKDFGAAEAWLWKSIQIKERQGDELGLAASYVQLGVVAATRRDLDAAEQWYSKFDFCTLRG